jgi:hypothetical protein
MGKTDKREAVLPQSKCRLERRETPLYSFWRGDLAPVKNGAQMFQKPLTGCGRMWFAKTSNRQRTARATKIMKIAFDVSLDIGMVGYFEVERLISRQ